MLDQVEVTICEEEVPTVILRPMQNIFEPLAVSLLTQFKQLMKQNYKNVILDLSRVEAISAAGLGMLRYMLSEISERNVRMPLACQSEKVLRLLKISGLLEEVKLAKTTEEALQQLHQGGR